MTVVRSGAMLSPCRTWRYSLWRVWDESRPVVNVIGLNPSKADETADDPTIRRCIGFARSWGYGGLIMTNLFAFRSTDPKRLLVADDAVGPDNNRVLLTESARAGLVLAAWGNPDPRLALRARDVLQLLAGKDIHCLKHTAKGHPWHPLYVRASTAAIPFRHFR